ncbi:MAG: DM13 domain-containing protein [Candidatus Puniceispirillaceae bacterium]
MNKLIHNVTGPLLGWAKRHLVLFGALKFLAGLIVGFGLGVYFLPILTAEKGLDNEAIANLSQTIERSGSFVRDLADSDALHWGEGTINVSADMIWLDGKIAPGPDYRLYMTPYFVETEAAFRAIKDQSVQIAPIKAFENFAVDVPAGVDVSQYPALLIWCEAFGQFITAASLSS